MPETSIVIRSFNEAEYIGKVLDAVSDQEYQDFEIILVDSGSTDGTLEIAEDYVDKIEFVAPHDFTFGHSCNVGCEASNGRFVSFLSAHAIPTDEQWLGPMIDNLRDDEVAMTYTNQIGAEENKFSERRLFNELFQNERKHQTPPEYFANNASSTIRKDLWKEHQFDEYLTGHEDIEWAKHFMDQGYKVVYESEACIYHIHDETWEQVHNRFKREAVADVEIGIKSPSDRWREYAEIPIDVLEDTIAAVQQSELDSQTFSEILRFRYNQHVGTAAGLKSERNLELNRFEYFYGEANERVVIDAQGETSLETVPLPKIKPNDVLIRTDYIGVSPNDSVIENTTEDQYPIVPGHNYVGTVIDLGANANSVDVGDIVVGETEFDCGVCEVCSEDQTQECLNPVRLGRDTSNGAYSKFLAVPSNHVHSLNTDPKDGAIVGTLTHLLGGINRSMDLIKENANCAVVGNTSYTELVIQILEKKDHNVERFEHELAEETIERRPESDLLVDTTGDPELVQKLISHSDQNTVFLLLATNYEGMTLSYDTLANKAIIDGNTKSIEDFDQAIQLLHQLDTEQVLDGTYTLEEYELSWEAAREQRQFPVISVDQDITPGSIRRDTD